MPISKEQEKNMTLEKCAVVKDDESYAIFVDEKPKFSQKSTSNAGVISNNIEQSRNENVVCSDNPFKATSTQMKNELVRLEEELDIANAKLQSLQEAPPSRPWHGRGNFTCTNCHYKGHKVSKSCRLPTCKGFHECGILTLHQEQKCEISKSKSEVKDLERKVKQKKEELDSFNLMKDRTKGNFFSLMRPRVISYDPIKYSNRQILENDLRILAAALKHKVPDDEVDIQDIIDKKKNECNKYKRHSNEDYETPYDYNKERKRSRQEFSPSRQSLHYQTDYQHRDNQRDQRDRGQRYDSQQHQTNQKISDRHSSSHYRGSSGTPSSYRQSFNCSNNLNVSNHSRYMSPRGNTSLHTSTPTKSSRNSARFPCSFHESRSPSQSPITARNRFKFSDLSANLFDNSAGSSDSTLDNSYSREAAHVLANMGRKERS